MKINKQKIIEVEVIVEPIIDEAIPSGKGNYDDQTLEDWYDFAATIEGIIDNFCDTVKISLSKNPDSISEYIDFYSYDENGNKRNYLIDLRLSDHGSTVSARKVRAKHAKKLNTNYRLESIIVNGSTVKSYNEAIKKLQEILADYLVNG